MSKGMLSIKGIDKLESKLKKNLNLNDVRQVVKLNGADMQQNAMKFAPVDTGALKRDIHLQIENQGMTAKVSSDISYAPYQEWGTRFQAGTPHVGPAYKIQRPIFISDLQKLMK